MGLNSQDKKGVSMIICESDNSFLSCQTYLDTINPSLQKGSWAKVGIQMNCHVTQEMYNTYQLPPFLMHWQNTAKKYVF